STRLAEAFLGTDNYYSSVLTLHWVLMPHLAVIQAAALLTVWIHACIGIHFWLRTKIWYPDWRVAFAAFALLLPTLALSGYLSAGNQVMREAARDPAFVKNTLGDSNITAETIVASDRIAALIILTHLGLLALVFAARGLRPRIPE